MVLSRNTTGNRKMNKENVFTGIVNGFFDFIATGNRVFDSVIKRLVSFTVLLWVLLAAVSSVTTDLYVGAQAMSSVFTISVDAADEAITLSPANKAVMDDAMVKADALMRSAQEAVGLGDDPVDVVDEGTEVPTVPAN